VGVVLEVAESVWISVDVSPGVVPGVGDLESVETGCAGVAPDSGGWEGVETGCAGVAPGSGDCDGEDFESGVGLQPRMNPSRRSSSLRAKSYD